MIRTVWLYEGKEDEGIKGKRKGRSLKLQSGCLVANLGEREEKEGNNKNLLII